MSMNKAAIDEKDLCRESACPSCGGIECFERPRYFSGQLLTDKDLSAAQRYVIEKNKLHNRYLVGTGVVCGLAVRCGPCGKNVLVEPGYAIDCCGNDIVLCEPVQFNVSEYIEKCLREKEPACEDKIRPPSRCDDLPKEYCLVLSYAEKPSQPVAALIRDNGCTVNRCEPSRTKETFRFDLVKRKDGGDKRPPNMWDKLKGCVKETFADLKGFIEEIAVANKYRESGELQSFHNSIKIVFCRMKEYLIGLYKKGPDIRCNLSTELEEIENTFPASINDQQYLLKVYTAVFRMCARIVQYILDCICNALLVPCVECEEEGVVLACLTLQNGKIEKICNIERQFVITGPALRYWLGPLYRSIGNALESLCCELDLDDFISRIFQPKTLGVERAKVALNRGETTFRIMHDFSAAARASLKAVNFLQFLDPDAITPSEIYKVHIDDVLPNLKNNGITAKVHKAATHAEAYSLKNLLNLSWAIPRGSNVEIITDPDGLVTFIRVVREGKK